MTCRNTNSSEYILNCAQLDKVKFKAWFQSRKIRRRKKLELSLKGF